MSDEKKPTAGHTFEVTTPDPKDASKATSRKFKTLVPICIIPGVNEGKPLTSLEISSDDEAQAYLVKNGIGSIIEEIIVPAAPTA